MGMPVPMYALEGVSMGSLGSLIDAIEMKMLRDFSAKLDAQGIGNGARVPASAIQGMGSIGSFGGILPKSFAKIFKWKQQAKVVKAKQVATAAQKQKDQDVKKLQEIAPLPVNAEKISVLKTKIVAAGKIEAVAKKEAEAPMVTKAELVEAMKPAIHAAAVATATATQKGIVAAKDKGDAIAAAAFRRKTGLKPGTKVSNFYARTKSRGPFEEMLSANQNPDVSGFGIGGVDVTNSSDAFGAMDASRGADAFGFIGADVSRGGDAFGSDVSRGGDAFGSDVSRGGDAFGDAESVPPVDYDTDAFMTYRATEWDFGENAIADALPTAENAARVGKVAVAAAVNVIKMGGNARDVNNALKNAGATPQQGITARKAGEKAYVQAVATLEKVGLVRTSGGQPIAVIATPNQAAKNIVAAAAPRRVGLIRRMFGKR